MKVKPSDRVELPFFASIIKFTQSKTIVEVGVHKAESTVALVEAAEATGGHVYGFDLWDRHGLQNQFAACSSATKEIAEQRLKDANLSAFTLIKIDTRQNRYEFEHMLDKLCPNGIDFAFIDGCHSYLGVRNDFAAVYPRIKSTGIIAFHDTLRIDGCREFMLDLRTKYFDGTYDIIDFPQGWRNWNCGITLLIKRSYATSQLAIEEVCGSIHTEKEIEQKELKWYEDEIQKANPESLDSKVTMVFDNLGRHDGRKKLT